VIFVKIDRYTVYYCYKIANNMYIICTFTSVSTDSKTTVITTSSSYTARFPPMSAWKFFYACEGRTLKNFEYIRAIPIRFLQSIVTPVQSLSG